MKKKIISLLLVACCMTSMATGCGSSEEKEKPNTSVSQEDVDWDTSKESTVVISTLSNFYTAGLEKMAEEYTALHPETKVEIELIGDNDSYRTNFTTKVTSDKNNAPDIIHVNLIEGAPTDVYAKGWIEDLSDMMEEENPYQEGQKVKDIIDEGWLKYTVSMGGGKTLYLPFDLCGISCYYNKTLFDENGLEIPETLEEWLAICETFKELGYENPISATSVAAWYNAQLADWVYRTDTEQYLALPGDGIWDEATMQSNLDIKYSDTDDNFDKLAIFNQEKFVAKVKNEGIINDKNKYCWSKFHELSAYFQDGWRTPDEQKASTDFVTQNVPMILQGSWVLGSVVDQVNRLPEDKSFEWGTFALPAPEDAYEGVTGNMRILLAPGHQMGITKKDDPDQLARTKDVLKFWYSSETAKMIYEETLANGNFIQGPPIVKGVELSDEIVAYLKGFLGESSMRQEWVLLTGGMDQYIPVAQIPVYNEILEQAGKGEISTDEFLEKLEPLVQGKMDELIQSLNYDLDPTT